MENETEGDKDEVGAGDFNPGAKSQDRNKAIFRRNYGVEKALPGFYILDAKICPKKIDYVLKVVKYIIPDNDQKIKTYRGKEEPSEETMSELFEGNENYKK